MVNPAKRSRQRKNMVVIDNFSLAFCSQKYFDIHGNVSVYEPPTTAPPTLDPAFTNSHQPPDAGIFTTRIGIILGSAMGGVVFLCVFVICCLVMSKRTEKRKRSAIEQQYRVVATTLTNITDSEDGCTYESVSMNDPTYRSEPSLPTRKVKQGGISNGLVAFKRWMSFDGEISTESNSSSTLNNYKMPTTRRTQPLPSIPEPPGSRHLMDQIDAYTENGNVYNRVKPTEPSPYDTLRESLLMREPSVKSPDLVSGGYFSLEKTQNTDQQKPEESENKAGNEYFTLEKQKSTEEKTETVEPSRKPTYAVVRKSKDISDVAEQTPVPNNQDNSKETTTVRANTTVQNGDLPETPKVLENGHGNLGNGDLGNTYFTLEKTPLLDKKDTEETTDQKKSLQVNHVTGLPNRSSDYLEPVPKTDKNVYLSVLPEPESTKL